MHKTPSAYSFPLKYFTIISQTSVLSLAGPSCTTKPAPRLDQSSANQHQDSAKPPLREHQTANTTAQKTLKKKKHQASTKHHQARPPTAPPSLRASPQLAAGDTSPIDISHFKFYRFKTFLAESERRMTRGGRR